MNRPPEDWHRLASYVISARREAGFMEQKALAAATGITDRTIGKLERGERVGPATLAAVAKALDWTPDSPQNILEGGEPVKRQALAARVVRLPSLPPVAETDPYFLELPAGVTEQDVEPLIADIGRRVARRLMEVRPGETVPGEQVFDAPRDRWLWDTLMQGGYPPAAATRFVAAVQAEAAKGLRQGRGSG